MNKGKSLFWIFFIIYLFVLGYIYFLLADRILFWGFSTAASSLIIFFIFVLVIIPFVGFFAERSAKFGLRKGLNTNKNYYIFLSSLIVIIVSFISLTTYDAYREKEMNSLFQFQAEDWDNISFYFYDTLIDPEEHPQVGEQLQQLFEQHRVKRMPESEWEADVSKERGFSFSYVSNDQVTGANIYGNRMLFHNDGNYYYIVNGPFDMESIEEITNELK